MQELRFVAVSEDGQYAVLGVPGRSARFTLPIDERLRAVALGQTSRLAQYEIEVESPLRPKEIQARIRAGETVEEIADAAGIAVERVRWFEGPVLAERAYMADQAQQASVRRQGDATPGPRLGEIVAERMKAFDAEPDDAQWDAKKRGDGSWLVQLTFITGGRLHAAEWIFDPRRRHVLPADDNAARMSLPGSEPPQPAAPAPGEATVTHLAPRLNTGSGFGPAGAGNGVIGNGLGNGGRPRYERPAAARPAGPEPKVAEWEAPQPREAQPREDQSWESQPRETQPREAQARESQTREPQPRESQAAGEPAAGEPAARARGSGCHRAAGAERSASQPGAGSRPGLQGSGTCRAVGRVRPACAHGAARVTHVTRVARAARAARAASPGAPGRAGVPGRPGFPGAPADAAVGRRDRRHGRSVGGRSDRSGRCGRAWRCRLLRQRPLPSRPRQLSRLSRRPRASRRHARAGRQRAAGDPRCRPGTRSCSATRASGTSPARSRETSVCSALPGLPGGSSGPEVPVSSRT